MPQSPIPGLTAAEVADRIRDGQVNRMRHSSWADYAAIASRHLFTLFNLMVVPAAIALFVLGEWQAGIAVSSMAIVNSAIGLVQEFRAKRQLDRLAILVETKARVIRDGREAEVPAGDVVLGDCILLRAGETVIADGEILDAQFLEVDEALLTGESDPVRRQSGDRLLSGSICVAGEGAYRADKIGGEAFAQSISAAARRYSYSSSPMTHVINQIIKVLTFTAIGLCVLYFVLHFLQFINRNDLVLMIAATITSMVPQGLVLTATISFTLGAVVMSRRGALVQRLNAVEAMASIDVICTDKTGTLTTNRLRLERLQNLASDLTEEELRRRLSLFISASVNRQNKNIQALLTELGETKSVPLDQIPFKSKNRFSAVRLRDGDTERILVLGAPEAFAERGSSDYGEPAAQARESDYCEPAARARDTANSLARAAGSATLEFQRQGLRVLLFGEGTHVDVGGRFASDTLPSPLRPLALVTLADELRPEAGQVLQALSAQGIAVKVISGDNPETVRATVAHLDLPLAREPVVTGQELAGATDKSNFVENHSVFGRVEPLQKVEIVEALQRAGHLVAMIGDGVNDVLPIKRSDLGIAMGEGTQAAKTVSSLVLENNNFAMLPETIEEGRTIVRNLRRAGKLFLVKNVYSLILILFYSFGVLGLPFPYRPQQVTLLNWLVIGIPAFIIALTRERSTSAAKTSFLREVGGFALRTGAIFGVAGIAVLALSKHLWQIDEKAQRTMLLSVLILLGITALLRVLTDGENQSLKGDRQLRWLGLAAIPAYLLAMYWPLSARFFELTRLEGIQWLEVLAIVALAYGLSVLGDRWWWKRQKNPLTLAKPVR